MIDDIKTIATRCSDTILQDFAGAASLLLMLVVGLHLPQVF